MSDNGKILSALLIGAAAGAVVGLLYAPSKGSELRQKIKKNAGGLIDDLASKITERKDALSGLKNKAVAKTDELKTQVESELGGTQNKSKSTSSSPVY